METRLKPYTDYRDAGLPWVGEIPSHWRTERAKWLFNKMDRPVRPEDETITCFRDGEVTLRKNRRTTGFTESLKEIGYQGIRKGDLVIHAMDAFAGAVGVSDSNGKGSPVYSVCRPKQGVDAEYYARVVREMARSLYIAALATGIRERSTDFRYSTFVDVEVPVPPIDEQRAASQFLQAFDRRTNRLIHTKQRLIELLNEQKQAIIQRAVTRGLDPDVPMKPSGVDWLGDVPVHWEVKRLKWVTRLQRGYDLPQDQRRSGPFPVISSGGFIDTHDEARAQGPGVVMGRYGSTDAIFYVKGNFWPHNTSLFVTDFHGNDRRWCYYLLQSISKADHSTKSAVPGIDRKDLYDIYVALPPTQEQEVIAAALDEQLVSVDQSIATAHQEIDLIREYRTRLIADVVTGKLDVRPLYEKKPDVRRRPKKKAASRPPNAAFRRATVAAAITDRLNATKGFGRVQLQKALVVVERHLQLDLDIKPRRKELGPFDNNAMRSVHSQFKQSQWFKPIHLPGGGWRYEPMEKLSVYRRYINDYIDGQTDEFQRLMRLFERMDMTQSEIVTTLYIAWNDELVDGRQPTDDEIVDQVLNNWHPAKQRIPREKWLAALDWMRDPKGGDLVPTGFGASTKAHGE